MKCKGGVGRAGEKEQHLRRSSGSGHRDQCLQVQGCSNRTHFRQRSETDSQTVSKTAGPRDLSQALRSEHSGPEPRTAAVSLEPLLGEQDDPAEARAGTRSIPGGPDPVFVHVHQPTMFLLRGFRSRAASDIPNVTGALISFGKQGEGDPPHGLWRSIA